jgi:predicted permease
MAALWSRLQSWLLSTTQRNDFEQNMDEEIRFHIEARTADLIKDGLAPHEAARQARLEFGGITTHKDSIRGSLGLRWWDDTLADLRFAVRILRKNPIYTLIGAGSLALAIAANATIFSVANELLFERLHVPHPEQLQMLQMRGTNKHLVVHSVWGTWRVDDRQIAHIDSFSYPIYQELRRRNTSLNEIFGFKDLGRANITVDGSAQSVRLQLVSGNYYQQMQVSPRLGRAILPADDGAPGGGAVAVISDGLWARAFGRSPDVIGRVITVNTNPVTIIGVNPAGFTGATSVQVSPDVFVPLSMIPLLQATSARQGPLLSSKSLFWINLMARSKPGVTDLKAQAELNTILAAAIRNIMSPKANEIIPELTLGDGSRGINAIGEHFSKPIYVLAAMVVFVLLLACANVANLMLARTVYRQREMSVRLALGASRSRILRQLLTEGLLLALLGGSAGLLLAYLSRSILPSLVAKEWERVDLQVAFDWRVFAFTAAITVFTGLLFSALPALAAMRAEINSSLKESGGTATRHRRAFTGKAIVVAQVALSTLLVAGAALFIRTLINLNAINPGFHPDHLLLVDINPPSQRYAPPKDVALHARIEQELRSVPGVESVALTDVAFIANERSNSDFNIEHEARGKEYEDHNSDLMSVGPDFFHTMGIPIVAGRAFTREDAEKTIPVAVINQTLAKRFFPGKNPLGMRFSTNDSPADQIWYQIIGISGDTYLNNLRRAPDTLHFDLYRQQKEVGGVTYVIHTMMKPEDITPSLRAAVKRIDADLPLIDIRTQQQQIDATMQEERIFASLTVGFGILALALACVGIYGIMTYTVTQRTNEIGIRLALGAQRARVRAMVLRESSMMAVIGVFAGLAVALALSRLVKSMLFGLQPHDPLSLGSAALLLLAVALTAAWIPAARASHIEPMEALRHD